MSAKRIILVSAGVVAVVLAAAVAAAFVPAVQTRLAQRSLAVYSPRASLVLISASPSRVALQGLRLERDGAVLEVPSADAELGVLSAILGRGYLVRSLTAKGWTLDLTRSEEIREQVTSEGAAGSAGIRAAGALGAVLAAFSVPEDVSVDGLDLEGVVILPDENGHPMGKARVSLKGGGLAAGRTGHFDCAVDVAIDAAAAPVSSVAVRGTLDATMEASGTFAKAELKVDATAIGPQVPKGISLSGDASASRGAEGRTLYSLAVTRGAERIASADASSPDHTERLSGTWSVNLRDTDLAPFALGRILPAFYLAGSGTYGLDALSGDIHAEGKARGTADRLGVLALPLAYVGRIEIASDFDVARSGDSVRVDRLETSISGRSPALSVRALQPFEFNPSSGELKVARPSGDLVGISVTALPPSWLHGFLPGVDLEGGKAKGEFVMRAENGRLVLRTKAPLVSSGVSISEGGRLIGTGLEVSTFLLADYSLQGWQVQVAPLKFRSEGVAILSVEARVGRLSAPGESEKAAGSWSASLPGLLAQPLFSHLPRLTAGDASGSFEANLGSTREVRVKVSLGSLAVAGGAVLPTAQSDARLDFLPDGRCEFNVPLRLDYGTRTSALGWSGTLFPQAERDAFDATFTADRLGPDELAVVAALSGRPMVAPGPDAPAAERGPSHPFWPAVRGRLAFVLQEVSVRGVDLHDFRGTLQVDPTTLHMESGMASVGDQSAIRVDGDLAFDASADKPYGLKAAVSADNVDSGALFQDLNPDRTPFIEGRFSVNGHVEGTGVDASDLLSTVQGDCKLASKGGTFRMLQIDVTDAIKQAPSMITETLDTVSSLFGKKADKLGEAIVGSATGLAEIHYDQMSFTLTRGPDLDIVLGDLALLAPEERLTGSGRITYAQGLEVPDQPLAIDLDLGVRGTLSKFMGVVGLLADGKDELGYTHLYQMIPLRGTLHDIDRSKLKEMVLQAPLRKGGGLFDKLIGR